MLIPTRMMTLSIGSSTHANRRRIVCQAKNASAHKSGKSAKNSGESLFGVENGMYQNMTPLDDSKATNAPNLKVFEVQDAQTKETLDHLFYNKEEKEPASCVRMPGIGLVCGSEEFLLHSTQGCIHAEGVYYALPHDVVQDLGLDITDEAYELLGDLSQATFDQLEQMDEL